MTKEELELQFKREEFIFMQKSSIEKDKREGREEGLEKGREERNIIIATNLKKTGMDSKTIATVTGLATDFIDEI